MYDEMELLVTGKCKYADNESYGVRIYKNDVWYGSGDEEDLPQDREDRAIECYYIAFEAVGSKGKFNTGGGTYLTLEEAKRAVEAKTTVEWD